VKAGGETREVDGRPSDALNLALRLGAPIFVDAQVLEKAGVPASGLHEHLNRETERSRESGDRPPEAVVEWVWISAPPPEFGPPPPTP
jgi:hypothetical protein